MQIKSGYLPIVKDEGGGGGVDLDKVGGSSYIIGYHSSSKFGIEFFFF